MRLTAVGLAFSFTLMAAATANAAECLRGIYSNGEQSVFIYDRENDAGIAEARYFFVDGRRGTIGTKDSIIACENGAPIYDGRTLPAASIEETDTTFESGGVTLAGRLIEPAGAKGEPRTLAVFVHGSESTPTVGYSAYPYLFAAEGVSVFAYDKRGTGASDGEYTQDFHRLAGDAVAAAREARRLAAGRYDRFGLYGGSQGGWVAPLAANDADADFIIVGFGLVLTPLEEDAEQVFDEMRRAGYDENAIEQARIVTDATGEVVAEKFSAESIAKLHEVKNTFRSAPWLSKIEGEFTGSVLRASADDLAAGVIEGFNDLEVPWRHDAVAAICGVKAPQLWVIAAEDTVAPGLVTRDRLAMLQREGSPITTALFPDTEHGMWEFAEAPDGSRTVTRITEGYFRLVADYMKDALDPPYGRGVVTPPE